MFKHLQRLLHIQGHKELMLIGLYITSIIIYAISSLVELYLHIYPAFVIKMSLAVISAFLLSSYLSSRRTSLYAMLLVIIIELEIAISVLNDHFYSFTMAHPFVLIFSFFFFFRLKTALIATALHYVYWFLIVVYTQGLSAFTLTSTLNMIISSTLIFIFSLFYYFSTNLSYARLDHSNRQNEILIKEIHHRIKNNLNMIASILGLQIVSLKKNGTDDAGEVLHKSKLRIEAIAQIHEALYKSDDFEKIDFADYVRQLTDTIYKSYGQRLSLEIEAKHITLPLETMLNLGIIINELITNTLKHSSKNSNKEQDSLLISLDKEANTYIFTYHEKNNHIVDLKRLQNKKTLGMKLIRLTVRQMDAELEIFQKGGLIFLIVFNSEK